MALRGLDERVVVVTGAAGGIGVAVCERLVEEGARVVAVDADGSAAGRLVQAFDRDRAVAVTADVATEEGTDSYVSAAVAAFGRIDAFHNNAGIEGSRAPIVDGDVANFDRVIAVNLRGVYLGLRAVLRQQRAQGGGGSIVNTASVAGLRAHPGLAAYVASKHGVAGLTKCAAIEAAPLGIRVNAVCPGPIDTRMMASIERMADPTDPVAARTAFANRSPMGRYGTAAEVAALVCWLISDESSFVNGVTYPVDGGRTAA